MTDKRALILHASTNRGVFAPEAAAFMATEKARHAALFSNADNVEVDCDLVWGGARRNVVLKAITDRPGLEVISFFCHGWESGIQLGFDFRSIDLLVAALAKSAAPDVIIPIYGCLTADNPNSNLTGGGPGTDGGFADQLRDKLCKAGLTACQIFAHKTAGHATMNPYVVKFAGDGTFTGEDEDAYNGGEFVIEPGSALWHAWVAKLHTAKDPLRFDFPFMTQAEVVAALGA